MSLRDLLGKAATEDTVLEQEVHRYNHDFLKPFMENLAHIGLALRMTYEQQLADGNKHAEDFEFIFVLAPLPERDMLDRMDGFSKYESGDVRLHISSKGLPISRALNIGSKLMGYSPSSQSFETVTWHRGCKPHSP